MSSVFKSGELLYLLTTLFVLPHDNCSCASKKTPKATTSPNCDHKNTCTCARGGVVSNSPLSAGVGRDMLAKGGSAVDAAIATLFCEGVMLPHAMGIGGGFLMILYDSKNRTVRVLNARETAPGAATENMFDGKTESSAKGGLSVCVPGEVRGYWAAHQLYGKLPWAELVKPASIFAKYGFKVTPFMGSVLAAEEEQLKADEGLRNLYINPKTEKPYRTDQIIKNGKLGLTLEKIAENGESALYDGELTQGFIDDITKNQGILTVEDMKGYEPIWDTPLTSIILNDHTLYTVNAPGSGAILILILNILENSLDLRNIDTVDNWHKIIESFKFGYAAKSGLGDTKLVPTIKKTIANLTSKVYARNMSDRLTDDTHQNPEYYGATVNSPPDHGSSNIIVFAANGDVVAVTSTINQNFGAGILSESTGIILNNVMNDFSMPNTNDLNGLPASELNYIAPGKRPLTSMTPTIVTDCNGCAVFAIGATGGTRVTSAIALVILRHLVFKESLSKAITARRLLHQLIPMHILTEYGFCESILKGLMKRGHRLEIKVPDGFATVNAMIRKKKSVSGSYDPRRGGQVALLY